MTDTKKNSALADPVPAKMTDAEIVELARRYSIDDDAGSLDFSHNSLKQFVRAIESRALSSAAPQEPEQSREELERTAWHNFNCLQIVQNYLLEHHLDKFEVSHTEQEGDEGEAAAQNIIDCIERIAAPAQPQEQPVAAQQEAAHAPIGYIRAESMQQLRELPEGASKSCIIAKRREDNYTVPVYAASTAERNPWAEMRAAIPPSVDAGFDAAVGLAAHPAQAPQQAAGQARELPPVKLARSESRPGLWLDENGRYYELAYQLPASGNWLTNEQIDIQVARSLEAIGGKIESATPYREVRDFARNLVRALWTSAQPSYTPEQMAATFRAGMNTARMEDAAPAQPTVPEGFALVPRKATEGMIRAAFGWRESDSRAGLIGDADMYERIYYAMISAALASSPDVPGEWERLLTQVIPYRLKLIERGECVDASVEAIRECVARLLASAPAQPTYTPEQMAATFRAGMNTARMEDAAPAQPTVPERATGYVAPKGRYVPPVLFNPYTGEPRDARDIHTDPQGILIVPPGAAIAAAAPVAQKGEKE